VVDPVLRYINTYVSTGGQGNVGRNFLKFSLPHGYLFSFAKGLKWGTLPHKLALLDQYENCTLGRPPFYMIALPLDKVLAQDEDYTDHESLNGLCVCLNLLLGALGIHYTGDYSLSWHFAKAVRFAKIVRTLDGPSKVNYSKNLVEYVRAVLEDAGASYRQVLVSKTVTPIYPDTLTSPSAIYLSVFEFAEQALSALVDQRSDGSTALAVQEELARLFPGGLPQAMGQPSGSAAPSAAASQFTQQQQQQLLAGLAAAKPVKVKRERDRPKDGKPKDARGTLDGKRAKQPELTGSWDMKEEFIGLRKSLVVATQDTIAFKKGTPPHNVVQTFTVAKVMAEVKKWIPGATVESICLPCLCSIKLDNKCYLTCCGKGAAHAKYDSSAHKWPAAFQKTITTEKHFQQP
jgi:hypothetical protein